MLPGTFVPQTIFSWLMWVRVKKRNQNKEFKQRTINKCINKICYRRTKKQMKLNLWTVQHNLHSVSLKYLHVSYLSGRKVTCVAAPKVQGKRGKVYQISRRLCLSPGGGNPTMVIKLWLLKRFLFSSPSEFGRFLIRKHSAFSDRAVCTIVPWNFIKSLSWNIS